MILVFYRFQNPPWQVIKYDETSQATNYEGLIFKIVDQLAQNLNFRYIRIN
jgi:hypothetical protein